MPNIDGGHYFLTVLAPVITGEPLVADGVVTTHSHLLRQELANCPTAQQSPVSVDTGLNSPFARCHRTHFLRFAVIDQPMFNGRDPMNPLVAAVLGKSPLKHQPFDVLSRPWLLMSADFDLRANEPDQGLRSWAEGLWVNSEPEMRAVFSHCVGFETAIDAAGFASWIARCQVETTMSFNDYWPARPPLKGVKLKSLLFLVLGLALVGALLFKFTLGSLWWVLPGALLGVAAGVALSIWMLWSKGVKSFPAAPDSDLPSVLKALHVQQRFAFFAEAVQGYSPDSVYDSFGQFLRDVRPSDISHSTQPPGVIRSDGVALAPQVITENREMIL